jgi:hypothetical protein
MRSVRIFSALLALWAGVTLIALPSGSVAGAATNATAQNSIHGFDFLFGKWATHFSRLRHPLSSSHDWFTFESTSVVRPIWDGRGNIEDSDLPMPRGHVFALTLRIYNVKTGLWSLYWGTAANGVAEPPQVGRFDANGVGQFFADDTYQGKKIGVRYKWTHRDANHCRFEQAFSTDHGKTWETNWTTDYTREKA